MLFAMLTTCGLLTLCLIDYSFGPSIENYIAIKGGLLVLCSLAATWIFIPRFGITGLVSVGIVAVIFSVLAYLTQTWSSNEFFWTIVLSVLLIGENRKSRPTVSSIQGIYLIPISLLLALLAAFGAVRNVDFYFLHLNLLSTANPNAVAGLLGAALLLAAICYRATPAQCHQTTARERQASFPVKCLFASAFLLALLALLGTLSRLVLLWLALLLIVSTSDVSRFRLASKLSAGFIFTFSVFALLFTLLGVSNQGETVMSLLEKVSFDWRIKGDVESDFARIKYSQILYNYMLNEELLFGEGFGVRGYRAFLGQGEDLHNAYLTTLSDCGFVGVAVLLSLSFVWPLTALLRTARGGKNRTRCLLILGVYSSAAFFPGPLYGSHFLALALTQIVGMADFLEVSPRTSGAFVPSASPRTGQPPRQEYALSSE